MPALTRDQLKKMSLGRVESAYDTGLVSDYDFVWFRCLWRNGASRITQLCLEHEGHDPVCNVEPEEIDEKTAVTDPVGQGEREGGPGDGPPAT